MKFTANKLAGVWVVEMERHADERGWFARTWCSEEFAQRGLNPQLSQCSASFNHHRGTLRGMHYQAPPHEEDKVVRCVRGAIFDVALDLRPSSPTFRQWTGVELTPENGCALYVPAGCAHGFQTLADNTEVLYHISGTWHPECARAVRWNDPAFGITWPQSTGVIMNDRDRNCPDFTLQP
jgi:dTDP-4-dehydrorhamnose 3,5-epimerase